MAQFTLHIYLGNGAMRSKWDIARALRLVEERIVHSRKPEGGAIMDANGNRVGSWEWNEDDN